MAKSKLIKANEKIAQEVVGGYKKIEEGVVGGFNKIADRFVDNFLTKDGESVEEAKARLSAEQKAREEAGIKEREQRSQQQNTIATENLQKAKQASFEARRKAGLE